MSGEIIFAVLTTVVLIFFIRREGRSKITLVLAAAVAISWLVAGVAWMTGGWDKISLSLPDLQVPTFAVAVTGVVLYFGNRWGQRSPRTISLLVSAGWLAAVIGWWAGGWGGILAITIPSLIVFVSGLLALPPFVLPVHPLPWKTPSAVALLYTMFWLSLHWAGRLEMGAISLWVCLQGLLLIFRPAIPIESVKGLLASMLFVAYGFFVFAAWRFFSAAALSTLDLLALVQGLLVFTCYVLPVAGKSKRGAWQALALIFGLVYLDFMYRGRIDVNLTNAFIMALGLAALLRFVLPGQDETASWAEQLDNYIQAHSGSRWARVFGQYRAQHSQKGRSAVVKRAIDLFISVTIVLVILAVYVLVWVVGLTTGQLKASWLNFFIVLTGWGATVLPLFIKSSDNWHTLKAIVTYNLGRNYPYYAVVGDADEPGRLAKRAAGNSFLKLFAGPGITLSNSDHAFVVSAGTGFAPERVAPPGLSFIGMYEDVKEIVDLRYQLRARPAVPVKAKDGIDVKVVTFTPFRLAVERAVAVTPDGRRALLAHHSGNLKLWNLDTMREERTLVGHTDWARAIALTPDGRRAVSASSDDTLKVWNLDTGQAEHTFVGYASVRSLAVANGATRLVLGSPDGSLQVFKLKLARGEHVLQQEHNLAGHTDWVYTTAVTPDGRRAVSASLDATIKVWNLQVGLEERTLDRREDWVTAIALTPDGHRAVSASSDGRLKLWNLDTAQLERELSGRQRGVRAVAVPDGRHATFVSADGSIKTWDLQTGKHILTKPDSPEWSRSVGKPAPKLGRSLPYDPEAITKAVWAQHMQQREQHEKSGWGALVRQTCKPVMRDIIAGYTVDELCSLYDLERDPRVEIAASMRDKVRAQIRKWGLDLIGGGVSNLVPPDEVIAQRIAHWQAHLQKEVEILEARAEARERHMIEHARARAEKELIMRITEVYEQLKQLDSKQRQSLIALRLLAAIDQAKSGQDSPPGAAPEIQATLDPLARGQSATGGKK